VTIYYTEEGDPVDLEEVDERGFTLEERLAAIEAAIQATQAGAYVDDGEFEDDYEEGYYAEDHEDAILDAVAHDAAVLEEQLGRELLEDELLRLADFTFATGALPSEAYGAAVPHIDLNNEDDRVGYAAEVLEAEEARQERQDEEQRFGLTDSESAAQNVAAELGGYDEEALDDWGEGEPA
jgi:hypothetical protein